MTMFNKVTKTFQWGKHTVTMETGEIARQATGAVLVDIEGTVVLATVVCAKVAKAGQDFFPLTVDYIEKTYAAGKIPGSFFKREAMSRWSDRAWEAAAPTFRRILEHPFVHELAAGTLPAEKFRFYIRQDALYLDGYARRLAHIAARLPRKEQTETFLHFALEGIEVERALHAQFLDGGHPSPEEISPACLLYTSVLDAQATAPVEVEAAAVLPCFVVYQRVGEEILRRTRLEGHPYAAWISTYADPGFAEAAGRAAAVCDELAEAAGDEIRRRMTDLFVRCTKMEWLFWDSAWNLEKWNI